MTDEPALEAAVGVREAATSQQRPPVLALRGISKAYGPTRALAGVDFEVRAGEIHALLGQNGSGKSTLMKVAFGEVQPDEGEMLVNGAAARFNTPHDALRAGLAMVPQEVPSALDLTVTENVLLGNLPRRLGVVDWANARRRASELLAQLGAHIPLDATMRSLAPHERQLVAIAHALSEGSTILILDEPTSSLAADEAERLFAVMSRLRAQGIGLVFITQRLREVTRIADRITIIRDGSKIAELLAGEDTSGIESLVTGAAIEQAVAHGRRTSGAVVLEVQGLSVDGVLRDVAFSVRSGEVVGLSGLVGCGRTELIRCLFGVGPKPAAGEIRIHGEKLDRLAPSSAIARGMALVTADRRNEGLVLGASIHDNLMMVRRRRISMKPLNRRAEKRLAEQLVRDLRIKTPTLTQAAATLSGGNQQKVVLGKWLALSPSILLLDEPTRGIDVAAKADFYRAIERLASEGVAVVVGSLDDDELLEICDRVVVLRDGSVVADVDASNASEDLLLAHASGLETS